MISTTENWFQLQISIKLHHFTFGIGFGKHLWDVENDAMLLHEMIYHINTDFVEEWQHFMDMLTTFWSAYLTLGFACIHYNGRKMNFLIFFSLNVLLIRWKPKTLDKNTILFSKFVQKCILYFFIMIFSS